MSEREVNARRNWKAQTFPYDHYIPDNSKECQYCLTDKQAEILRGIIEPLGWKTRWWSETDVPISQDEIEQFRDDIIARLMMSCCGDENPVLFRYTVDGVLQKSIDGGATWENAPENDPRNNSTQFPPISGSDGDDKKCIAATGMAELIKEQIGNQLTDDMSRYTLGQLITDWVKTMLQTSNPFQALLTTVTNQIFALVIAVLRPALTDAVYETLKCIFYCNMADDASFDDTQWEQVRSDITDMIGGIAGVFLEHLVYLLGVVGLTNLARSGGATSGDCSTCGDCAPCQVEWAIGNVPGFTGEGVIDSQDGFVLHAHATNSVDGIYRIIIKTSSASECCNIASVDTEVGVVFTAVNYINCGDSQIYDNIHGWAGALIGLGELNYLGFSSTAYFEIGVNFA